MYVFILIANLAATLFFTSLTYAFVGIPYTICALVVSVVLRNSKFADYMIAKHIKTWGNELDNQGEVGKSVIISIAFLVAGIKLSVILGLIITFLGIALLALAIYIACHFVMRGGFIYKVLQSIGIAQIVTKIYLFITSWLEKIVLVLVKLEFKILGIEIKEQDKEV